MCPTVKQARRDISSCLPATVSYRAVTSHTETTSPIKNNVTGKETAWQVQHTTADFYSWFNCSPCFHVPYCAVNAAASAKKKDKRQAGDVYVSTTKPRPRVMARRWEAGKEEEGRAQQDVCSRM